MNILKFYIKCKSHIQVRDIRDKFGNYKIYYICNYGIPMSYSFLSLRNVLHESKSQAIIYCYYIQINLKVKDTIPIC
jgi:hypothetical protein